MNSLRFNYHHNHHNHHHQYQPPPRTHQTSKLHQNFTKPSTNYEWDAVDGCRAARKNHIPSRQQQPFRYVVSGYLAGEVDTNGTGKTRVSYDNFEDNIDGSENLTPSECDQKFHRLPEGIDIALHRAKVWSKYAKDMITYIERRTHLDEEHAKNLIKLAQTMKPAFKEESYLPFQSIYCGALDQDIENSNNCSAHCSLILGHKFIEPLIARRNEHEKIRKQIKQEWQREVKRTHDAVNNMRKAQNLYYQRHQEYERARSSLRTVETGTDGLVDQNKIDRKRKLDEEAFARAQEAEISYRNAVTEANERTRIRGEVKKELLIRIRELLHQCDQTLKAVTVAYFQSQHTVSAPLPVQFQTLCESSKLYEPGSQYIEFIKRIKQPSEADSQLVVYKFEPYDGGHKSGTRQGRSASESDSGESGEDARTSPKASTLTVSSGEEHELDIESHRDSGSGANMKSSSSKASQSHHFRRLKAPSKCRECDTYVCFQGLECTQCGLTCHRKCLAELNIACGHRKDHRRMTTFGVDLKSVIDDIPYLVVKCVSELEKRGTNIKGIYRVSSVKSRVEKLCQNFENGAELVDISEVSPNIIANVLKNYLRQLPEPLMTFKSYPDFIHIAKQNPAGSNDCEDSEVADRIVSQLKNVASKLPPIHFRTLSYLCHHLKRVAENHLVNSMTPSNLGIVWGPTLLRSSETASLSSLVDTAHQARVVQLLITFADRVFGPPESIGTENDSVEEAEGIELPYDCVEEDVDPSECTMTMTIIRASSEDKMDNASDSSSSRISRGGRVMDFSPINNNNNNNNINNNNPEKGQHSIYPSKSSSVIKLSGQQILTSSFNPSKSLSECSTMNARPSLNELRRQFFTGSPTQLRSLPTTSSVSSSSSLSLPHASSLSSSPLNSTFSLSQHQPKVKNSLSSLSKSLSHSSSSQSIDRSLRNKGDDSELKYI
ncbi:rho GTPase-activating protein 45-like isoform X2 [Brevipalpus obovatus]|uniref:rho GTPase-activating protein 45-like isoform X2 n=1 Tax=Brevipalpus obovatus TaxID=246614 RepID=UPI003D9F8A6C